MGDPHNTDEAGRIQTATGIRALSAAAIPEGLEYLRAGLERRHDVGRQLIGLTVKDAREVATRSRCTLRLVRFNGKGLIEAPLEAATLAALGLT